MKVQFPFAAIVGQEALLKALSVCAVNPAVGGVLVRGDKGTAKSTAARALAEILPPIEKCDGCGFNCFPQSPLPQCVSCNHPNRAINHQIAPFVNLPIGATEDRVIGSLDIEKALQSGRRAFQPGLLASAHRGILYIDEVNLLPDHLVDSLLDAAASGVNTIEREGIAFAHPSSFALIGTMNLEEGDLRPQLLDRFALMVEVAAPADPQVRAEIVRRRAAFDDDSAALVERFQDETKRLQQAIVQGRQLLPSVLLTDEQVLFISTLCARLEIRSLRADLVINKAARALAALDGRRQVSQADIQQAAQLALPHRMRTRPGERSCLTDEQWQDLLEQFVEECGEQPSRLDGGGSSRQDAGAPFGDQAQGKSDGGSPDDGAIDDGAAEEFVLPSAEAAPVRRISMPMPHGALSSGRRSDVGTTTRGAYVRAVKSATMEGSLAVDATIRSSMFRNDGALKIDKQDLHVKQRLAKAANTVLFVVDASGSMAALQRMSAVKGAVLGLLEDAYKCRDTVGVIAFRGDSAQLVLPPTRSTDVASKKLNSLPTGGRTPLASALQLVLAVAASSACQSAPPLVVLLTDGKANVALTQDGDPIADVLSAAGQLRNAGIASVVVDTEAGYVLLGQARNVAEAMAAEYLRLAELSSDNLKVEVKAQLAARRL